MDDPCPWGDNVFDVRTKRLTNQEKEWLANQFINGVCSAKELHERYKVPISQLYKYVNKIQNGDTLYEKSGRPFKLDNQSIQALNDALVENRNMQEDELRQRIRSEYLNTIKRKNPNLKPNLLRKVKVLKNLTIRRYAKNLRERASSMPQNNQQEPANIPVAEI